MTFFYMATPYSKYHAGCEAAYEIACANVAILMRAGLAVYSPIVHSHPLEINHGLDKWGHDDWINADMPMMEAAHGLIVCKMAGWKESRGVQIEIGVFTKARKRIIYMEPNQVPEFLRHVG